MLGTPMLESVQGCQKTNHQPIHFSMNVHL